MKSLSVEVKVGIFALIVLILFSFMTFKVGEFDWLKRKGYTVYIYFSNTVGLDKRTRVKVAGVDAGVIEDISLQDSMAKVRVRMYEGVNLYSDASALIKISGFLGDKFLEIRPGSKMPLLKDGGTITSAVEVTDIDSLIRKIAGLSDEIGRLSSSLNEIVGSEESKQTLKESLVSLKETLQNMNKAIAYNDKKLREVLESINEFMKTNKEPFSSTMANLSDLSGSLKDKTPSLLKNIKETAEELKTAVEENRPALKSTIERLDKITGKLESGEGTLGRLLNDEGLYESANEAMKKVNKTMSAIDSFKTFITFQGEYLTKPKDGKAHFYLTLQPKPEYYLILGVVDDPVGKKMEKEVEFSAQLARRFKDTDKFKDTAFRFGLIENTLGVGADQFFLDDRLKVSLDAWDFTRDESGAKNPHIKFGADYFVFKNIFISGGIDNILNSRSRGAYIGGGVRFGN